MSKFWKNFLLAFAFIVGGASLAVAFSWLLILLTVHAPAVTGIITVLAVIAFISYIFAYEKSKDE